MPRRRRTCCCTTTLTSPCPPLAHSMLMQVFGMKRAAFDAQPKWKRDQQKKAAGLF